ncbi:MAG: NAD-dependent epimerase/dehydratase [Candidatus Taylorbacteria bacterium]|nr:NAD-dependent epimerase/dehydratase [Candidatus Taylorbacteria bacterium]
MKKDSKIFVAGGSGLVGSAIIRELKRKGYTNVLAPTHKEVDLMDEKATLAYFNKEKPEYVFLAAAKVGGIIANKNNPADFIFDNLKIQNVVIHSAYKAEVKKLLFLGSSCIYPKFAKQPIKEEYLMTSALEETNDAYAIAKIAGIKMCDAYNKQYGTNFIAVMPTNLYGPFDNFDPVTSHVIPSLIRKFHDAILNNKKEITLFGDGTPKREFLYIDDAAEGFVFLMNKFNGPGIINLGSGVDMSIKSLAQKMKEMTGFKGKILWDTTKPNGTPRKLLDVQKIKALGWKPKTSFEKGLKNAYEFYKTHYKELNER